MSVKRWLGIGLVVVAFLISGCAAPLCWRIPQGMNFTKDDSECSMLAIIARGPLYADIEDIGRKAHERQVYSYCMTSRGYTEVRCER